MTGNFDTNELVATIVDQAHQIRRMNDMLVATRAELDRMAKENEGMRALQQDATTQHE